MGWNACLCMLALLLRLWQTLGYLHLWVLTGGMGLAMLLAAVQDDGVERRRITVPDQAIFFVVILAYVFALALIGGAVLARYMLPVVPLVIILAVSTLRRRLRYWPAAITAIAVIFAVAWFWNPPYGFSPEDNLAYRDYVVLHQDAERFLEARYPMAHESGPEFVIDGGHVLDLFGEGTDAFERSVGRSKIEFVFGHGFGCGNEFFLRVADRVIQNHGDSANVFRRLGFCPDQTGDQQKSKNCHFCLH